MRRVVLAFLLAFPIAASAQTITVGTLQMNLKNRIDNGGGNVVYQDFNPTEQLEFFARSSCCDMKKFGVQMTLVGAPVGDLSNFKVELWLGTNCSDTSPTTNPNRAQNCVKVDTRSLEDFHNHVVNVDFDGALLMNATGGCPEKMGTSTVWGLIDSNADGIYDTGGIWQLPTAVSYDLQPPPAVANPTLQGVENGIEVSWDVGQVADVARYQILCADSEGQPLFGVARGDAGAVGTPPDPEYRRPSMMCVVPTADAGPADIDAGPGADAGPVNPDFAAFDALDPRYVCSGSIGYTSGSTRIDLTNVGLAADDLVFVKIVSIDPSRNYTAVDGPEGKRPVPVKNAWSVYEQAGGQADGGFCFVATAVYGDYGHPYVRVLRTFRDETLARFELGRAFIGWYYAHSPPWAAWLRAHAGARVAAQVLLFPVVALAWLWNQLGLWLLAAPALSWWTIRRWRRRRAAAVAALGLVLVAGAVRPASAQVILDEESALPAVPRSDFAFEIKLGPYRPNVDSEPGLAFAPYDKTFGSGKIVLPQIELDWFPFHYFGELGVAFSLGYTQQTANAFIFDPNNPTDLNSRSADTTGFHLLPFSVSAVYRFTELADRTLVPIVPYAKLGLSYYTWWVTRGTGALATTRTGKNALGGTPGWQASLGVSVRVDAIDPEASKNLSVELGIEHVGVFFELTHADVSGLWMSNKLYVGDTYWSAGVNFEF